MEKKRMVSIPVIIFASLLVCIFDVVPSVNAQPYYDAYFTSVKVTHGNEDIELISGGTAKVYAGQLTWINLTYYNEACGVFGANLYTKVYVNNALLTTSGETYVLKGTYYGNQFYTYGYGAVTLNYKVELWWDSSGTHYLEDVNYFSIQVVKLSVADWSPAPLSVEKGKTTASTLSVSFKNGGNDLMYSASTSIVDSGGLQILPMSADLGDIASQGTKSTSFSVVAPSTLSTGSKTVAFQISYDDFRGTSHVESKTAYVAVTKLGTSITLTLEPSSLKKDSSTTITAELLDGNGNPIANQPVSFFIGTTTLGSADTDSSGNAVKTYTANVDAGTYTIKASYTGSTDYGSSSATSNLIVNLLDTTLTINAPSVKVEATATITTTLKDENGNPVSDANIDFYLYEEGEWTKISSATTDAVGEASITQTFNTSGDYQIKTVYAGSTNYKKVNATATLTISQFTTTLTIDVPSTTQGKEVTLEATLKDEKGNWMQNIDIGFYIYEENAWKNIGSAKTDSNGLASLNYTPSTTGTFQVKAMFGGTSNYSESSSTSASLDVAMDYTPYYLLIAIVIIAVCGAAGYAIYRRRKKPTEALEET